MIMVWLLFVFLHVCVARAHAGLSSRQEVSVPLYRSRNETIDTVSRQVSSDILRCTSSDPVKRSFCNVALHTLNARLAAVGLKIDREGVLFTHDNPADVGIDTGRSCSITAQTTHRHFSARIKSSSRLDLRTKSISQPVALRLRLPVQLHGRINMRQRFGFRLFGKCRRYATDNYAALGWLNTYSDTIIGVSLHPSFRRQGSGHYTLTIKPVLGVAFELENTNLRFRIHGAHFLTSIWTGIIGFKTTLLASVGALFRGKSVKHIWNEIVKKALPWDFGAPVVLGIGALPGEIERFVWRTVLRITNAASIVEKRAKGFGPDIEDNLNAQLRRALRTDSNGQLVFHIRGDFVDLLRASGDRANIFYNPSREALPSVPPRVRDRQSLYTRSARIGESQENVMGGNLGVKRHRRQYSRIPGSL